MTGQSRTGHGSMLQFIATRDHRLMRKVNKWPAPKWIRLWAIAATRAGDGWLWYLTGLSVLLFGGENRLTAIASAGSAAITAFAVAIALAEFYPALFPALLFCALSIAASRILLGMHFLSDVLVGALLGTGLALSSHSLFT